MSLLRPKLGLAVTCMPIYELAQERISEIFKNALQTFQKLNVEVIPANNIVNSEEVAREAARIFKQNAVDLVCVILGTWTPDNYLLAILDEIDVPIVIWALPNGKSLSLCGSQLWCSILKEFSKKYWFIFGEISDSEQLSFLEKVSKVAALVNKLKGSKVGLVGHRPWIMKGLSFDELSLKEVFGVDIVHIGLDDFNEEVNKIDEKEAEKVWNFVKKKIGRVLVGENECLLSVKYYLAMKNIISSLKLDAITIECEPKLKGRVCLANSLINDELEAVAACESDIHSAIIMLMLHLLTGKPVFSADQILVYEEDNSIVFSHCGSAPLSLAESSQQIVLDTHKEINSGLAVFFPVRPFERVTVVNLSGRKGTYRMCIAVGEGVKTDMVYAGTPMRVRFSTDIKNVLKIIAEEGFGHHWVLVPDDVGEELRELCKLLDIKCITIY